MQKRKKYKKIEEVGDLKFRIPSLDGVLTTQQGFSELIDKIYTA